MSRVSQTLSNNRRYRHVVRSHTNSKPDLTTTMPSSSDKVNRESVTVESVTGSL